LNIFRDPVGLPLPGLAALTYLIGAVFCYHRNKPILFSLLLPILFVLVAAILGKYPFAGRLLLFIIPLVLLLIAEGIEQILNLFISAQLRLVALLFILLLLYHPLLQVNNYLKSPKLREEIEPAIAYIDSNWQDEDKIYLYYASHKPFEYYSSKYSFGVDDYIVGVSSRNDWSKYLTDLDNLQTYNRVWLLFSHVYSGSGVNEQLLFLNYLTSIGGIQKNGFQSTGAAAYLYEFEDLSLE
jgi:hypothetical protein